MLGVIPDTLNYTWSSGSTLFDKRNLLPMDKMSKKPSVTSRAYNVLEPIWSNTRWARGLCAESPYRSHPTIVLGNLWTTVPKTARVDRSIAMEPSMNVAYQLGVGKIIRSRLKHWGLDLVSLQPHHQKLVSLASVRRHLATIDLSSASDLICSKLVEILLPEDWHDLLYSLRSEFTCYALSSNDRNEDGWQNGDWRLNEKFSSMGNGYTFELETLIFYSLSLAVQEIDGWVPDSVYTSVYGDDIIIPDAYAPYFIKTLTKLGMKPNPKKTFYGGFPFRESCGSDFYFGTNVRPFYVETFEPENPQTRVVTANSIALAGIRSCGSNWFDLRDHYLKRAWNRAVELIPSSVRSCRGPTVLGDIVLWDSRWRRYARQLECGAWRVKALKPYFDDKYYISYDRDEWTRASIIDAAVSGYLQGAGDSVNNVNGKWIYRKGKLLDSRPKVEGYKIFSLNFCEDTSMIQKFIDNSLGIRCDKEIDRLRNKRFGSNAELNFGLTVE
nr:MAG: RNA replicase beta chain [Guiyang fiers-like virus 1]